MGRTHRTAAENGRPGNRRSRAALGMALLAVVAGASLGVPAASADPAAQGVSDASGSAAASPGPITDIREVSAISRQVDSEPYKQARAICPGSMVVLGGGAWFHETSGTSHRITLRVLQPGVSVVDGALRNSYFVEAAETPPGVSGEWYVVAVALCAFPPSGYHRVVAPPTPRSSDPVQTNIARCPSGERTLGSGAWITPAGAGRSSEPYAEVGLQVARASGTGDITRAQAHEDANGYAGTWSLTAAAICADPPLGYEVRYGESIRRASETEKSATATCSDGNSLIGAGAAISNVAPGNATLSMTAPTLDLDWVIAAADENVPTDQSWDFIVSQAICAVEVDVD
jgi:hypothetical protein